MCVCVCVCVSVCLCVCVCDILSVLFLSHSLLAIYTPRRRKYSHINCSSAVHCASSKCSPGKKKQSVYTSPHADALKKKSVEELETFSRVRKRNHTPDWPLRLETHSVRLQSKVYFGNQGRNSNLLYTYKSPVRQN